MKSDLFTRILLIIIVTLLALNVLLPTLSNPPVSYAAKNIEYKIIDTEAPDLVKLGTMRTTQQLEIFFNELGKEGWEYIERIGFLIIFKR